MTIYPTANRIYRLNIATGVRELKSTHPQFTLVYYSGAKRIRQKFSNLATAQAEARNAVVKLANGDAEALKLTGRDRASYLDARERLRQWRADAGLNSAITDHVRALRQLHEWHSDAELTTTIADYIRAMKRLPDGVSLTDCVTSYVRRHPAGLPYKTSAQLLRM